MRDRKITGVMITGGLLVLLFSLLAGRVGVQRELFCQPVAHLAGAFFGAGVAPTDAGYGLNLSWPMEVTTACSGITFFCLLVSVLVGLRYELRGWGWRMIGLIPLAYAVTVVANTGRIVASWYTDGVAQAHFPVFLHAGAHTIVGFLFFLFALLLTYVLVWRATHESPA